MKGSLNKVYTVEWVKGFETSDEDLAIEKAATVAFETGTTIRIFKNGAKCYKVNPMGYKGVEVVKEVQAIRVVNKYHHLLKYNTRDFKRLSF